MRLYHNGQMELFKTIYIMGLLQHSFVVWNSSDVRHNFETFFHCLESNHYKIAIDIPNSNRPKHWNTLGTWH